MSSSDEVKGLEASIQQARVQVELGSALNRLFSNRDFKKVIIEGFFEQEAIRLVHLKAAVDVQTPDFQASILKKMDAIGGLKGYFSLVQKWASEGAKSIESDEQAREELLAEGLDA